MKTTIEIPDALAAKAKEVAHAQQSTLRELVLAGLRAEITRRERAEPAGFHFPTAQGDGLAPGVSAGEMIARSYDLPA